MEWLRCNKCYRAMTKQSRRTFSLTQCGHLYCSQCMTGVTTKCPECETQDFTTMTLFYPPKLETTHNYFAYLDEFLEICQKTAEFQYNQLSIAMRGFKEIEKKYENMKKSYWNGMEQMKSLMQAYNRLQEDTTKQEKIRESLLKWRKARNDTLAESRSIFSSHAQRQQSQYSQHSQHSQHIQGRLSMCNEPGKVRNPGLSYQYEEQGSTAKFPTTNVYTEKSHLQTPRQAYNPTASFPIETYHSDAYASDSGLSSIPGSSASNMGVFLVPSGQKVPRSAASLKKKTPSSVRLTKSKIF